MAGAHAAAVDHHALEKGFPEFRPPHALDARVGGQGRLLQVQGPGQFFLQRMGLHVRAFHRGVCVRRIGKGQTRPWIGHAQPRGRLFGRGGHVFGAEGCGVGKPQPAVADQAYGGGQFLVATHVFDAAVLGRHRQAASPGQIHFGFRAGGGRRGRVQKPPGQFRWGRVVIHHGQSLLSMAISPHSGNFTHFRQSAQILWGSSVLEISLKPIFWK